MSPKDLDNHDSWNEWRKYVLVALEQQTRSSNVTNDRLTKIEIELGQLKVKAGLWGGIAGSILGVLLKSVVK